MYFYFYSFLDCSCVAVIFKRIYSNELFIRLKHRTILNKISFGIGLAFKDNIQAISRNKLENEKG